MRTRMVSVSRRLKKHLPTVALFVVVTLSFLVSMAASVLTAPEEPPKVMLEAYNSLAWLSQSLDKMVVELREFDELLARNRTAIRLRDRMFLQRGVNDLSHEYAALAGYYNQSMRETGYRFANPAKLPVEAAFGTLPRRHEPFVPLKSGPRN